MNATRYQPQFVPLCRRVPKPTGTRAQLTAVCSTRCNVCRRAALHDAQPSPVTGFYDQAARAWT